VNGFYVVVLLLAGISGAWFYQERRIQRLKQSFLPEFEKLQIIMQHIDAAIMVIDQAGLVVYCSPFLQKRMGVSNQSLLGTSGFDLLPPDVRATMRQNHEINMRQKRKTELMHSIHTPDGRVVHMETHSIPITSQTGEVQGVLVISRNVTERKISNEQIRRNDMLKVLGQLSAGIAHEIRNPLTSLKGFLQLLMEGRSGNPDYYKIMLEEVNRLEIIASEFLLLSKPQALRMESCNVQTLIGKTVDLMNMQALMKNVELAVRMPKLDMYIHCDEYQIRQVLINIIKNAIEAVERNGKVEIKAAMIGDKVRIDIQDNGPGIPEHVLTKIGEPFLTTKEKGTGLGIMVCFAIMKHHQGELRFHNATGGGALAEIELPLSPPPYSPDANQDDFAPSSMDSRQPSGVV
jgi:two-component system, sporulation sensor kinase A